MRTSSAMRFAGVLVLVLLAGSGLCLATSTNTAPQNATSINDDSAPQNVTSINATRADVVFVLDVTGSMADEIEDAKANLLKIAGKLQHSRPQPELRFGAVFFRDLEDSKPVVAVPLTRNLTYVRDQIAKQHAAGGGDTPEHIGLGLHTALDDDWSHSADGGVRRLYLIGDAPAHHDYDDGNDVPSALKRAREMGVVINAVACYEGEANNRSALAREFVAIAEETGGELLELSRLPPDQRPPSRRPRLERGDHDEFDEDEEDDEDDSHGRGRRLHAWAEEETKDLLLLDVTPLSLGVEAAGGAFVPIVPRNSVIPTRSTRRFVVPATAVSADGLRLRVLEGERSLTTHAHLLGELTLPLADTCAAVEAHAAEAGEVLSGTVHAVCEAQSKVSGEVVGEAHSSEVEMDHEVEVAFEIDANGILSVQASAVTTTASASLTVTNDKNRLSQEEIERMVADAEEHLAEDCEAARKAYDGGAADGLRPKDDYVKQWCRHLRMSELIYSQLKKEL